MPPQKKKISKRDTEEKSNPLSPTPDQDKSKRPLRTLQEVAREMNWGGINNSTPIAPNSDQYIAGTLPDANWKPSDKDWELFANMMRDRHRGA
jgi:hypothetical protein